MSDVLITPASSKVEFKDASNNIDGIIELDASGNLKITAPNAGISLGDTVSDIYIGDGVNNIDIVFEQNGAIRALTGKTLTLGQSDSNVTVATNLNVSGDVIATDILPPTDNTGVVGNSSFTWSDGRFTNFQVDSILTVRSAIDLADSDILRFGAQNDFKMYYDGSANEMEFEMEAACNQIRIHDNGTTRFTLEKSTGNITATGDINSNSDIKLKTNIQTLTNSLDKVLQMRGVEFDRIDIEGKHQIGFIAQEIEEIVPELVNENNGIRSVSYGNITALLVEAIKEQQEQINNLKQEIQNLKK